MKSNKATGKAPALLANAGAAQVDAPERLVITEKGLVTEFLDQHTQRTDRPFCFILGAGASAASGIPTGSELAQVWLSEMHEAEDFGSLALADWATAETLGIPGFDLANLGRFYPMLYRRRYAGNQQAGYAFLEAQMEGKEPSYGYSVLAYLLSETAHRIVITTNFDNLVADALSIHSSRFPIVVAHDALVQYAAAELRRPLVAKIHGALGFAPRSEPDEVSSLSTGWREALGRILARYTPIVIGYDGNDGSLMSFLQSLPDGIPDRVLWCVYAPHARPPECLASVSAQVRDYVAARHGHIVPIRGFDQLMAILLSKLRENGTVPDLYERLKERARRRERSYDEQQRRLFEGVLPEPLHSRMAAPPAQVGHAASLDPVLTDAVSEIAQSRRNKPWWKWVAEAYAEHDLDAREAVLLEALAALPDSAEIMRAAAVFYENMKPDLDRAEEYYKRSLDLNATDASTLAYYATFLEGKRHKDDEAEVYYKRSIEADPDLPFALTHYATFLAARKGPADTIEEYFQRALLNNPNSEFAHREYAGFLDHVRHDRERAQEHYRRASALHPQGLDAANLEAQYRPFVEASDS